MFLIFEFRQGDSSPPLASRDTTDHDRRRSSLGSRSRTRSPAGPTPFVPLPGHLEAEARLRHAVEKGESMAVLRAPGGLGKTAVLTKALEAFRSP